MSPPVCKLFVNFLSTFFPAASAVTATANLREAGEETDATEGTEGTTEGTSVTEGTTEGLKIVSSVDFS